MADGVNISRGNPRSSSVGEKDDVEEIRYRSTTAIDPSKVVTIEDCGIPLGCGAGGDDIGSSDPCDSLDLTFYNVMGQEDRFRQINGKRIDRGGIARIVFTTEEENTVIEKIEYERQPQDEDNPVFNKQWTPNPPATDKHEVFVNVSPDSLYAFRVTISVKDCPDTNTSGIYYFSTGNEIIIEPEKVNLFYFTLEILQSPIEISKTADLIYQSGTSVPSPYGGDNIETAPTLSLFSSSLSIQKSASVSTSLTTS